MVIEKHMDLFSVPEEYYLAHCISADFAMGAGIALEFNRIYNIKNRLNKQYGNWLRFWDSSLECQGDCIFDAEKKVFNLITKRNYWNKPTLQTMKQALEHMKLIAHNNDIKKIAMPLIGCGLDRLKWNDVRNILNTIFCDADIEILVCKK